MHEFEDLVEASVKLFANSERPTQVLRALYKNLFDFQAQFDTGFTHFRTLDALLAARFVYKLELCDHPDYESAPAYFDALSDFTFIEVPGGKPDGSFFEPPELFYEAGSVLWQRLVAEKRLTGPDAEAPASLAIQDVALDAARLAAEKGDVQLVACWYRLLIYELLDRPLEVVRTDPSVLALREIVAKTRALELKMSYGMLRDPDAETLAKNRFIEWWFTLGA